MSDFGGLTLEDFWDPLLRALKLEVRVGFEPTIIESFAGSAIRPLWHRTINIIMDNLYEELELKQDCSFENIKQQYRILARIHHPDMGGDEEKFKKIKLAYEILSDPIKRAEYDKTGNFHFKPDLRVQARESLSQVFFAILPNFDPNSQNIIEIIKHDINSGIEILTNNKDQCNVYIEKLELTKSKINLRGESPDNLFYSFVDIQIQNKRNDISNFDTRIDIAREMLKIIDDYTYGFAELPNEILGGGGFKYEGN